MAPAAAAHRVIHDVKHIVAVVMQLGQDGRPDL